MANINKILIILFLIFTVCKAQEGEWWRKINQSTPTIFAMVAGPGQFKSNTEEDSTSSSTTNRKSEDNFISPSTLKDQLTQKLCPQMNPESTRTVSDYEDQRKSLVEETHRFNILYRYMEERVTNLTLLYHSERAENIELSEEVQKYQESSTEMMAYMDMLEKEIMYLNKRLQNNNDDPINVNDYHNFDLNSYTFNAVNHYQTTVSPKVPEKIKLPPIRKPENDPSNPNYSATNIAGMSLFCTEFRKQHKICSDNESILESIMTLLNYSSLSD